MLLNLQSPKDVCMMKRGIWLWTWNEGLESHVWSSKWLMRAFSWGFNWKRLQWANFPLNSLYFKAWWPPGQEIHTIPLPSDFHGLCFHWLNIFQSTIHSREPWSAFFSYRNFKNRNDCICLLNFPVTTSSTKDLESWNDQKGTQFWNCTLLVKLAHLRFKSGIPWWFYHLTPTPKKNLLLFMNAK